MKSINLIFNKNKNKQKKELLTVKRVQKERGKEQKIQLLKRSTENYALIREKAIIGIIRACSLR